MEPTLVSRALMMATNLRNPPEGLLYHSGRGSQYAIMPARRYCDSMHGVLSMSRKRNCRDNALTERFFSSIKHERLTGNITRQERPPWRM